MTNSRPSRRPRGRSGSPKSASRPTPEELHPVDNVPDIKSFREFNLADDIQTVIAEMGITEPTPIQKLAIAPVLEGRDVIAKAETGTGKTLAFGAPMMSRIEADRASVLGLVLCPTRELALQVWEVLVELGKPRGVSVALVVGGDPMHPQVEALRAGAQVVVGTPGRVLDLANQRFLTFPWTEFTVLDEADEMLEIGFIDDVRKILDMCADDRQTLLFSATFPPELLRLARDHTKEPVEVATAKGVASVENITHYVTKVGENDRDFTLKRLINATASDDVLLVFCDRRVEVERVLRTLERTRLNVKALHGGYDQAARTRVMSAFRDGSVKVLVATDVASRGLDIKHVTHVINLSVPRSISAYTHRSGRTGRAGRKGAALTIVVPSDSRRWREIESQMTWAIVDFDQAMESQSEKPAGRESSRRSEAGPEGRESGRPRRTRRNEEESRTSEDSGEKRTRRDTGRTERTRRPEQASESSEPRKRRDTGRTERSRRPNAESEQGERAGERTQRSRQPDEQAPSETRPKRDTGRTRRSKRSGSSSAAESEPKVDQPEPSAASTYVRETRRSERDRRRQEREGRGADSTQESTETESEARPRRQRGGRSERSSNRSSSEQTESRPAQDESKQSERRPRQRRSSRPASTNGPESGEGPKRESRSEGSNAEIGRTRPKRAARSREEVKPPAKPETPPSREADTGGGFGAGI